MKQLYVQIGIGISCMLSMGSLLSIDKINVGFCNKAGDQLEYVKKNTQNIRQDIKPQLMFPASPHDTFSWKVKNGPAGKYKCSQPCTQAYTWITIHAGQPATIAHQKASPCA